MARELSVRIPGDFYIPTVAKNVLDRVYLGLHPKDSMYDNPVHYLQCGASAYRVIAANVQLAEQADVAKILDFGAGAGRVARWLCAGFPHAEVTVTDLGEEYVRWCEQCLGTKGWVSDADIHALHAPDTYDVIWAGSVLTHLSAERSAELLKKFWQWTNVQGLVIATTHGRAALQLGDTGRIKYIDDYLWTGLKADYLRNGFGYCDYEAQKGYGISLTSLSWIVDFVETLPNVRLVGLGENVWDWHQDVFAIQKIS